MPLYKIWNQDVPILNRYRQIWHGSVPNAAPTVYRQAVRTNQATHEVNGPCRVLLK